MGGQRSWEKLFASPSTGRRASDFCYDPRDSPNILLKSEAARSEGQPSPLSLSSWIHCPEASPSFVEFLMKNLEMVPPMEMLELIGSPVGSDIAYASNNGTSSPETPHTYVEFLTENLVKVPHTEKLEMIGSPAGVAHAYDAISETQRELWHNDTPKPGKSVSSAYTVSSISHEASARVRNQMPSYGGEPMNRSKSLEVKIQRHAKEKCHLWRSESDRINCNVFQLHPDGTSVVPNPLSRPHSSEPARNYCNVFQLHPDEISAVSNPLSRPHSSEPARNDSNVFQLHPDETSAALNSLSRPHSTTLRKRDVATDRLRRLRISESLKALQELVPNPCSVKGGQAFILDEITDYIKFLQFQVRELSRSRLGSEPTSCPLIFVEGYGHYVHHEQMMNEPLEEVIGKLFETNPSAATQLLVTKGLYLMPKSLVEGSPKVVP